MMDLDRFRARPGDRHALKRIHPGDRGPFSGKADVEGRLEKGLARLAALQELLYAQDRHALLLIFQGMDGAGKDSAIKHVMSGVSPQGVDVHSFKVPSPEELSHDFLWRAVRVLPARGRIGLFNRSYYEEVVVVRVHPEVLATQPLPDDLVTPCIWEERYDDINAFERHLERNGTVVRKFFLHVSREEQEKRLLERIDDPSKNWKFQAGDLAERARWKDYQRAYADAIAATSTKSAPWHVVPADHKWFTRLVVAEVIVETLESMDLAFPKVSKTQRRALKSARRALEK